MLLNTDSYTQLSTAEQKRYLLQMQVIDMLYDQGLLTVSEISKSISLSLPTVRSVLDELITNSIVEQVNINEVKGGRTPFIYKLAVNSIYVFVADVGSNTSSCAIINLANEIVIRSSELKFNVKSTDYDVRIAEEFTSLVTRANIPKASVIAVGISMPGLIDSTKGVNNTIEDEQYRNVKYRISKLIPLPVFVENDARMVTWGELAFGLAKNRQDSLVISWGGGIGLGLISNGEVLSGSSGYAGEFSHIRIVNEGELCSCGKRGCLQTIASTDYLLQITHKALDMGHESVLMSTFKNRYNEITVADIIDAALKGDEISIMLIRRASENLAWGLSILIQLNNPEQVIICGEMAKAGDLVKMPIMLTLSQYCLSSLSHEVVVDVSDADGDIGLKGLARLMFKSIFNKYIS